MGNKNNIDTKTLDRNIPILIWIDQKVKNKENQKYRNYIIKNFKYKFYGFTDVTKAIANLKKIEFIKTYIICSGKAYIKFIQLFKQSINEFMICPQIIIFTNNKEEYIKRNINDKMLFLNDPFYDLGGVEDKFKEIIKFLKDEKKYKTLEHEFKEDIKFIHNTLNENNIYDEENEEFYENDENSFSDDEIKENENYENYFSVNENIEEIEEKENEFPFENKDKNKESQNLIFPLDSNSNPNYLYPKVENDELNPFRDFLIPKIEKEEELEIRKKFVYGNIDESVQYNFEVIRHKTQ